MSWGVFVSFSLELTDGQWEKLAAQTANEAGAGVDWSSWPTSDLTWHFTSKKSGDAPVASLLTPAAWEDDEFEDVGLIMKESDGVVRFTLFAFLDRAAAGIHDVGCLARALVGAHRLGGSGSLVISSDGSAPANVGWRCSAASGALVTTALDHDETKTLREQACLRLGIGEE
jgi:hypothetical protein